MIQLLRVLIVEDSKDDAALLVRELERGGYKPEFKQVDTAASMSDALDQQTWDVVLADYSLPQFDGPSALALLQGKGFDLPFIIVSGSVGEDIAVAVMRAGAHDYIMKNNLSRLIPAVERELKEAAERREHRKAEETIRYLAYYDGLTNLPNRSLLQDRLQQAILTAQRDNKPLALLLMDLDHFKEINDTLGHHCGDLLLQQVGLRLRHVLRESDTAARLGGDEFAMLLPLAASEHAMLVAQKVFKAMEAPFIVEGLTMNVEASIGITIYPDHGANPEGLMQRADVAMYEAKQKGSGCVIYDSAHDRHSHRRLTLMGELRHAIDDGQLFLHYQPKISLQTGRVIGVEALVRWLHPQHGMIPPVQFIAPAEQTGLIKPLTLWVLNTALGQCRTWRRTGLELPVSVNLSARNLHDPQLPDQVAGLLQSNGVPPAGLALEITESIIMADPAHALETLLRLSKMGIQISLDDFGTGYSSLGYLKKLPVHEIKIDKSFVTDMVRDESDEMIVRSTIDLGHNLGRRVVAEGVEQQATWERLTALGCDAAQGYYMGRPIPAAELTRWLGESPYGLKSV
ncbi:MAG: EAL domain-containing protein [Nitrospirae bacterium]|nr:EAL domain-containing protein [Nitrospirota bacterium]